MVIYGSIIFFAWVAFVTFWFVSALSAKRSVRSGVWWRWLWARLVFVVVVVAILNTRFAPELVKLSRATAGSSWGVLGAALTVLGVALAIWARVYLGRNWGMPMSLKENPELVTGGPYAYIRHPIYSGMLLAVLGTSLVVPYWLVVFVVAGGYFIYSATQEEKIMAKEFPATYPAYKSKTKMLIPFVF